MDLSLRQVIASLPGVLVAVAVVIFFVDNPARIGSQPLWLRALILNVAIASALSAGYFLNPLVRGRPLAYVLTVCLPAMLPAFVYFQLLLPRQAGSGISAGDLELNLITDRSSNGIVEVGFSYPIFTPAIELTNEGLFTRQVMIFFRMTTAAGESQLFRAVRAEVPPSGLSVEATVRGMLAGNADYLFNPLALPPRRPVSGRVIFVISSLDDGRSFTEALGAAQAATLELREPQTGTLIRSIEVGGL
ncbi:MAG: hypothetical protein WD396_05060 [Pseudohongiellaceae bacterium]